MNKQQYLRELIPDAMELESFVNDYANRVVFGITYVPTDVFIQQEIEDITQKLTKRELMVVEVHVTNSQSARPFMHTVCATIVYEALTRGRNKTVGEVIEQARTECEVSNRNHRQIGNPISVPTDGSFDEICYNWIKTGLAFVYYIQFLYNKKRDHTLTPNKFIINIMSTIIHNSGDGNVINTGNNSQINANNTIQKGDLSAFQKRLEEIGVEPEEIKEISEIIKTEQPNGNNLGEKASGWVGKMISKALSGMSKISASAGGNLLATAIKNYFDIPS